LQKTSLNEDIITLLLKFADDTKIGQIIRGPDDSARLQECLNRLMEWAAKWGWPATQKNAKSCILVVTTSVRSTPWAVKFWIPQKKKEILACKGAATSSLVDSAGRRPGRPTVSWAKSAVHFTTGTGTFLLRCTWSPRTKADSDVLEKVQKRAVSMVLRLKSTEYLERLEELKTPTLQQRRKEIDVTEMYKIMSGKLAVDPNIWFKKVNRDGVLTRQAANPLNVKIPAARLELRKNFFSAHMCEKWNNLPSEIKNSVK
jgi:hypothetical protein